MTHLFFQLLQVAIGNRERLEQNPTAGQWMRLYEMSMRQTLVGVAFDGIERLPEEQYPEKELIMKWWANTNGIEKQNRKMNATAYKVEQNFKNAGFRSCILKGQGVSTLYPNPMRRQCGDIDIWLNGGKKKIIEYLLPIFPDTELGYHHCSFFLKEGICIEAHYSPAFFRNPMTHRRFQRYIKKQAERQFNNKVLLPEDIGTINVPTADFNYVFLLVHIYDHLLGDGIGLRQLLDYYYLMTKCRLDEIQKKEVCDIFQQLHIYRFAQAIMWVLNTVFGLQKEFMIVSPDSKLGQHLLDDIMSAGNFGHHYEKHLKMEKNSNKVLKFISRQGFYLRLLWDYPHEVAWMPFFNVYMFIRRRIL